MRTRSLYLAAIAALFINAAPSLGADEKFDGSTIIRGEGEISALPDVSTISITTNLSCWKDLKGMQDKANAFHNDLSDALKKFKEKGSPHKLSIPGVNLGTHTQQIEKETEKNGVIMVNDPECTNVNRADETITFKYFADVADRKKAMEENDSVTGFEKVVDIRNVVADVISKHVNASPKVDSIKATLRVNHDFSGAYRRSLRSEVRTAAKKDYDIQLAERENLCGWTQYKEIQISYSSDNENYVSGQLQAAPSAGGYAKANLSDQLEKIDASSITPGERAVKDILTVNVAYSATIKNCKIK